MESKKRCLIHIGVLAFLNLIILTLFFLLKGSPNRTAPETIKTFQDAILLISILLFDIHSLERAFFKSKGLSDEEIEIRQKNWRTKLIVGIVSLLVGLQIVLMIIY